VIHEYALPTKNANPFNAALGPDGNVWVAEAFANAIARITPSGVVTEFPVPTPDSSPLDITAGPDGNLWFTESDAGQIGRITTSGVFTEFPIPAPAVDPFGIAAGPDGRIWFTGGDDIRRVTTTGHFTRFALATGSDPGSIAAGPDGNMWFTEDFPGQVGRITTGGVVTEFPLGPGTRPYGIAPGPDGNLWVTEFGSDAIARITTGGTVTGTFPVPTPSSLPAVITPGPDGALWFTESDVTANNVGRITTSGSINEIPIPTPGAGAHGIAPGGDGNIWFTEIFENSIGVVGLSQPNLSVISYIPNRFFIPNIDPIRHQGDTVTWLDLNPGQHSVVDGSGMGLFSSDAAAAPLRIGGVYSFAFFAAGKYPYIDPTRHGGKGTVQVPITAQLLPGSTDHAQVIWSSSAPPAGYAFDVQVKRPGRSGYADWRTGVTGTADVFGPSDPLWTKPGTYRFRARMRNGTGASGFSLTQAIALS
jgi:virginiamycin B lyase